VNARRRGRNNQEDDGKGPWRALLAGGGVLELGELCRAKWTSRRPDKGDRKRTLVPGSSLRRRRPSMSMARKALEFA
jgi:hypothetical protein